MDGRRLIESLVPEIAPNARVVVVEECERHYTVTIARTTGVLAGVDVPSEAVEAAEHAGDARASRRRAQALRGRRGR